MPDNLPDAWKEGQATALSLSLALAGKEGLPLPWSVVGNAIDDAVKSRWLQFAENSGPWPCEFAAASSIVLRLPPAQVRVAPKGVDEKKPTGVYSTSSLIGPSALQDLVDVLPDVLKAAAGINLRFRLDITLGSGDTVDQAKVAEINKLLESISPELTLKQ
jgi:hypothetical protein